MEMIKINRRLARQVDKLEFSAPVTHVYNPLNYARAPYEAYLKRFGGGTKEAVLLGMNPGPFGMAQTGVPFGDVEMVTQWLEIEAPVTKPPVEHPKRPVDGFDCPRQEISGKRVWTWAQERFGTPERFFERFFVMNYCPLIFIEASGKNRTPDKLKAAEREALFTICDRALREMVLLLNPRFAIGIGAFAEKRLLSALDDTTVVIDRILHPSPASPAANKGWAEQVDRKLRSIGVQ